MWQLMVSWPTIVSKSMHLYDDINPDLPPLLKSFNNLDMKMTAGMISLLL